uniref:G domain-containing protein n=1 Tax=Panagrolaimus sp. JU765 TaxID=591449 RepID=A0AC34PX84_9BILA
MGGLFSIIASIIDPKPICMDNRLVLDQNVNPGLIFDASTNQFRDKSDSKCKEHITHLKITNELNKIGIVDANFSTNGIKNVMNILGCNSDEFLHMMLRNSDFSKNLIRFLMPSVEVFGLEKCEKIAKITKTSNEKFPRYVEKDSKYSYVSEVKTGFIVLLRMIPKFPVDMKQVIEGLQNGNFIASFKDEDFIFETLTNWNILQRHETLNDALMYINKKDLPTCHLRYQLKPIGKNMQSPSFPDDYMEEWLEQLFKVESFCMAVEDCLKEIEVPVLKQSARLFTSSLIEKKLFVVVDTVDQKNLFFWESQFVVVNGLQNVPAILDVYDKLESKNYCFAIFTNVEMFQICFGGNHAEKVVLSEDSHVFGLMRLKPAKSGKTKKQKGSYLKICPKSECSKARKWICDKCFQFVGQIGNSLACDCGEFYPENCQFKCFHENHGDDWISLVEQRKNNFNEGKKGKSVLRTSGRIQEMYKPTEIEVDAKMDDLKKNKTKPDFAVEKQQKQNLEILPIQPLLDECREIFVSKDDKTNTTDNWYNILVVGQSGVGKSSLLNAFKNYLLFPTADDALKSRLEYMVPCKFPVYYEDGTEKLVVIGEDDVNE